MTRPPMRERMLAAALLARCLDHAIFAWWVVSQRPDRAPLFEMGALFGIVDGSLGILVALLMLPYVSDASPRLLVALTAIDGAGRLATGIILRAFPGIPDLPMIAVPLFGVVGAVSAGLGVLALIAWLVARARAGGSWSVESDELFDPMAAAALLSFVVGYLLFTRPPATADSLRTLAVGASAVLAAVFSVAALGAGTYHSRRRILA